MPLRQSGWSRPTRACATSASYDGYSIQRAGSATPTSTASSVSAVGPRGLVLGEGRHYSCRLSGGGSVVLVDEAAEPIATADAARVRFFWLLIRLGWPKLEHAVRPLAGCNGRRRRCAPGRGGGG